MAVDMSGAASIAGFGDAYATKENPKTVAELAVEAFLAMVGDTGISRDEIGAVLTGRSPLADYRPQWNNIVSSYLQLTPEYTTEITSHGAGVNASLAYAAMMIATGVVENVLILVADNAASSFDMGDVISAMDADPQFERPYGPSIPSIYAQSASRYQHEFGVTDEEFAMVAVAHQAWAVHHPYATKGGKGPITVETVLESRMIADPIRLWNAAAYGPYGTAGALLVTSPERAAEMSATPIAIRGFGGLSTHEYMTDRPNLRHTKFDLGPVGSTLYSGARHAAARAYAMAGIGANDIGMVQCSNNFTHIAMILMEDFGFCDKGRAKDLVRSGRLEPGGDLPWNTNGGWLSFGQPGMGCGIDPIIEAVRQLRGEALGLQVEDPGLVLTHGLGGMMACHHVTLLEKQC